MLFKRKKNILLLIFVLVMSTGALFVVREKESSGEYITYICADKKTVGIMKSEKKMKVILDNKKHILFRIDITNSVASRYVSSNPKMTLWMNDRYIMIEDEQSVPYYDCSIGGPGADEITNPSLQIPADQVQYAPQ